MWSIKTTDTFDAWLSTQNDRDRASVLAALIVLEQRGPQLPRPWADPEFASYLKTLTQEEQIEWVEH